jgi:hypothetical protein
MSISVHPKPNVERIHALRASFAVEDIFQLTKIDRWFLTQMKVRWTPKSGHKVAGLWGPPPISAP